MQYGLTLAMRFALLLALTLPAFAEGIVRPPQQPQPPIYYFDPCLAQVRPHPCDVQGYAGGGIRLPLDPDRGFTEMGIGIDRAAEMREKVRMATMLAYYEQAYR